VLAKETVDTLCGYDQGFVMEAEKDTLTSPSTASAHASAPSVEIAAKTGRARRHRRPRVRATSASTATRASAFAALWSAPDAPTCARSCRARRAPPLRGARVGGQMIGHAKVTQNASSKLVTIESPCHAPNRRSYGRNGTVCQIQSRAPEVSCPVELRLCPCARPSSFTHPLRYDDQNRALCLLWLAPQPWALLRHPVKLRLRRCFRCVGCCGASEVARMKLPRLRHGRIARSGRHPRSMSRTGTADGHCSAFWPEAYSHRKFRAFDGGLSSFFTKLYQTANFRQPGVP
jgi:hypothetical protein